MPFLNDYLIGADPEFAIVREGHLQLSRGAETFSPWGLDHGGYVVEPHPKPAISVKELLKNLRKSMNDFALHTPEGVWKAEPAMQFPERLVTLGGHVHIDKPRYSDFQVQALDSLTSHMEKLDIFPSVSCQNRRNHNYGKLGDIRAEHGHFEYRSFPSWLFSQRVAKVCLIGSKLAVSHPVEFIKALGAVRDTSVDMLKKTFELFKGKDDDVDWVLEANLFGKKLNIRPDRDLRTVWNVTPEKETPSWKEEEAAKKKAMQVAAGANQAQLQMATQVGFGQVDPAPATNNLTMTYEGMHIDVTLVDPIPVTSRAYVREVIRQGLNDGVISLFRAAVQTYDGFRFRLNT